MRKGAQNTYTEAINEKHVRSCANFPLGLGDGEDDNDDNRTESRTGNTVHKSKCSVTS